MIQHYELYILGLLGIIIHYLKDYEGNKKDGKKYSVKQVIPTALLSTLTTMVLIYLREDIASMYVVTKLGAVILGYLGNSVFFSFVGAKKPSDKVEDIANSSAGPGGSQNPSNPGGLPPKP